MINKKNITVHLISLCVLFIEFVLCRYVFLGIHGMHQWPMVLFIVGAIVLSVSFFTKAKIFPIITPLAYMLGFVAGAFFQTKGVDAGGGRTNNLWIIWTVVFVCIALVSIIAERIYASIRKQTM